VSHSFSNCPIAAVVLAAGQSTRMGARNKLLMPLEGKPMVRHVVDAALQSRLQSVVVVTGHEAENIRAALPKTCAFTHNGDYENGMAGSLRAGIYRLQGHAHIMILLGDMPLVTAENINSLIETFERARTDDAIVVATHNGEWGNPALFGVGHFKALKTLDGDLGARSIMRSHQDEVIGVEIGEAALRDFDTVAAFEE